MARVQIEDAIVAEQGPYIYAIYSYDFEALYIGQTVSKYGALGRLCQHLSNTSANTFKQRLCSVYDYESVRLGEIDFFVSGLPPKKSFASRNSDYREAVEHLVNYQVIQMVNSHNAGCAVISRTRANSYTSLAYVNEAAGRVTARIEQWFFNSVVDKVRLEY